MNDDLGRALSNEPEIEPSRHFTRAVMAAVARAEAEPPPLAFPWRRALPGMVVVAAAAVLVVSGVVSPSGAVAAPPGADELGALIRGASAPPAIWTMVGLLVSLATMSVAAISARR